MPLAILIAVLKLLSHKFGFEVMELNALFTSLVAGTIFLIGFLISGVLSDYKESEKIPSELAAALKTILDDTYTIYNTKNSGTALQFIEFQKSFHTLLMDWFYKKEAMGFLVASGLILMKIEPFYVSLFLTLLVTFLIFYRFLLIKDLDNPFDYSVHGESGTEVSLKPLHDFETELKEFI